MGSVDLSILGLISFQMVTPLVNRAWNFCMLRKYMQEFFEEFIVNSGIEKSYIISLLHTKFCEVFVQLSLQQMNL